MLGRKVGGIWGGLKYGFFFIEFLVKGEWEYRKIILVECSRLLRGYGNRREGKLVF